MNVESLLSIAKTLRAEAKNHRDQATLFSDSDCVWTSRTSASHVLDSLAHALAKGAIQSCYPAESSSSPSATKTVEDSSPQ